MGKSRVRVNTIFQTTPRIYEFVLLQRRKIAFLLILALSLLLNTLGILEYKKSSVVTIEN